MADGYRFLTVWRLQAPLDKVWDALRDTSRWPEWWTGVLAVKRLAEGDANGVGQLERYTWKSKLPYELAFDMRTTRVVHHQLIEGHAEGELTGWGRWEFSDEDGLTVVRYHWHVRTTKLWMNLAEPALRPLFAWNHDWVMSSGGDGLAKLLGARLVTNFAGEDREEAGPITPPGLPDPMRHLGFVNYAVPPDRIRRYLPPQFRVRTRKDAQGQEWGFLSVVMFENFRFRTPPMGDLPRLRVTFLQTNYRAYVEYKDEPCVWFFTIQVRTHAATFDKLLFGTPTYYARLALDYDWNATARYYGHYRFRSDTWGRQLLFDVDGLDQSPQASPCFDSPDELVEFFCQPPAGYYREPDSGWVSRLKVDHERLTPKIGRLTQARSDILPSLGLVYPDELMRPHSILLHPSAQFKGYLPDRGIVL